MDRDKAKVLLANALKGFHGRFKKMYGQICLRVDERSYLSTGGNKVLSEISEDSFELCDISKGNIGELFRRRSDINAIIFGCSPDTVKVSTGKSEVSVTLEDLAMLTGPFLTVIPDASANSLLRAFRDSSVCLISGTGAISTGSNLKKAVAGIHIVEKACEAEVHGSFLGGTVPIDKADAEKLRRDFQESYVVRNEDHHVEFIGFDEEEFRKRAALIDFGQELVKKDLSYGSWGNLSVRLNDHEMLITPSSMDYFEIRIEDIVRVNINTLACDEDQRIPSSESPMHAAVYRNLDDCGAIIHTHSNGLSVFAACEAGFTLGNSELQNLIGDVLVAPKAEAASEEMAKAVTATFRKTHACVIPHHGGVFYGPSLDVVFPVAEAVEKRARNILGFDAAAPVDETDD